MTSFTLPWPTRDHSPNGRVHWSKLRRVQTAQHNDALMAARGAGMRPVGGESAHVTLTFCPPTKARRDLDNLLASMKGGIDGISDACGVDDSRFGFTLVRGPVVKGGEVRVAVEIVPPEDTPDELQPGRAA